MREGGQYLRHFRKGFTGAWMVGESSVSFGEKAKFGTRQSMILSSTCRVFQKDYRPPVWEIKKTRVPRKRIPCPPCDCTQSYRNRSKQSWSSGIPVPIEVVVHHSWISCSRNESFLPGIRGWCTADPTDRRVRMMARTSACALFRRGWWLP